MAQFSHLADLADQWDKEADEAFTEAEALPSTAGTATAPQRQALLNLARTSRHHAQQLRSAMQLAAAGALT